MCEFGWWFELRCQWAWWIAKLIFTSSHPSIVSSRTCIWHQKLFSLSFSSKHFFFWAFSCLRDDKKEFHDIYPDTTRRKRKCELIFYLHVSDVRSRFILILFWYVDWVTALTFYDSVAYLVHIHSAPSQVIRVQLRQFINWRYHLSIRELSWESFI